MGPGTVGRARRVALTLEGHSFCVTGVAVTPDGKRAVSASWDETLKVWDLETGRALRTLEGHSDFVTGVAVTPDGKRAVSASEDETLKVWGLDTPSWPWRWRRSRALRTLKGHSSSVTGRGGDARREAAVSASLDER